MYKAVVYWNGAVTYLQSLKVTAFLFDALSCSTPKTVKSSSLSSPAQCPAMLFLRQRYDVGYTLLFCMSVSATQRFRRR